MHIYEHKTSLLIQGGSTQTATLRVMGGLLRQMLVIARTNTTVFRAHIIDEDALVRLNWDWVQGTMNEVGLAFPIVNNYTLLITNASNTDTVDVRLAVQE